MSRNLVGIVTYGNLIFTKECIKSIRETTSYPVDFFIIVGKPGDTETLEWVKQENIPHKVHTQNMGFPYSINDIYDYTWKVEEAYKRYCLVEFNMLTCNLFKQYEYGKFDRHTFEEFKNISELVKQFTYDYLILAGNDTIAYPNCVNNLIDLANKSRYECISAVQYDVKQLTSDYPETRQYFSGDKFLINDFSSEPWKKFTRFSESLSIGSMKLLDIENFCLYKKSIFDVVGYTDVNFYPAYFVDNDYARRIVNSQLLCCTLANARFFHFWSRTIHQEIGGSTNKNFENSRDYYKKKWGGEFGKETIEAPVSIHTRDGEEEKIRQWRGY